VHPGNRAESAQGFEASTPGEGGSELLVTEGLEELRERLLALERELAKYGFDPRRGLESYSVGELREILARSDRGGEAKKLLLEVVKLQKELYRRLYEQAGLKELRVDTDTPEKRLLAIEAWLVQGKANSESNARESKFVQALRSVATVLATCKDDCRDRLVSVLANVYKRDYDRYRVLREVLSICVDLGGLRSEDVSDIEKKAVTDLVGLVMICAESVGRARLASRILARVQR